MTTPRRTSCQHESLPELAMREAVWEIERFMALHVTKAQDRHKLEQVVAGLWVLREQVADVVDGVQGAHINTKGDAGDDGRNG